MWEWIINIIAQILTWIQMLVGDWGLSIIVLTFLIRLALTPLQAKSIRSTAKMQVLQPKLLEIQERYSDDPQRMNEEMQKFYSENKFNPLGGCLPVVIQMPVFFSLFTVLRDRLPEEAHFYGIFDQLSMSPQGAVASFGWGGAWVYLLFLLAFGILTLVPMLFNQQSGNESQQGQMKVMSAVMALMMIWFGWSVPIGVVLYYVTSSAWGVVQQVFITRKVMEKAKAEEAERLKNAPVQVDVVRKERKQRPRKQG